MIKDHVRDELVQLAPEVVRDQEVQDMTERIMIAIPDVDVKGNLLFC